MRDHQADRPADLRRARRVLFHAGDLAPEPFVERGAHLGAVGADLVQLGVQRRQHAPRDRGAQRPADQPAALFAHPLLDRQPQRLLPPGQQRLDLAEHESQHLLVPAALHQAVQGARHHRAGAGTAQDARHDPRHHAARPTVLHAGQQARQHGGERLGGRSRGDRVGQEAVQDGRQVEPAQHAGDLPGGHHVVGDEAAQRAAQTLLLMRDDGGVRDRNAERMAEQRGDGEPVGDPADEAGFCRGAQQVGGVAGRQRVAGQREGGHQGQQAGREGAMLGQCAARGAVLGGVAHAGSVIRASGPGRTPGSERAALLRRGSDACWLDDRGGVQPVDLGTKRTSRRPSKRRSQARRSAPWAKAVA